MERCERGFLGGIHSADTEPWDFAETASRVPLGPLAWLSAEATVQGPGFKIHRLKKRAERRNASLPVSLGEAFIAAYQALLACFADISDVCQGSCASATAEEKQPQRLPARLRMEADLASAPESRLLWAPFPDRAGNSEKKSRPKAT